MRKSILIIIMGLIFISGCTQTSSEPCPEFHPDSQDKDNCLSDYAVQHKDPEICDLMRDINITREGCYYDVAILTNNIELCKKIVSKISGSGRDLCFKTIAINLTDETICGYISDKWFYKDTCYDEIAELTKNEAICNKLTSENLREDCIRNIRFPE